MDFASAAIILITALHHSLKPYAFADPSDPLAQRKLASLLRPQTVPRIQHQIPLPPTDSTPTCFVANAATLVLPALAIPQRLCVLYRGWKLKEGFPSTNQERLVNPMKKIMALFVVLCVMTTLACGAFAETAQEEIRVRVSDCEYKIVGFAQLEPKPDQPDEGTVQFKLIVEITQEPQEPITYHPNLIYKQGEAEHEIGASLRVLDIGAKVSMEFDPEDLYQTEGISASKGATIEYIFHVPADAEPQQIAFYTQNKIQMDPVNLSDVPGIAEDQ